MGCCEGVEIGMHDDVGKRRMGAVVAMKVGALSRPLFRFLVRFSALVLFSQAVQRLVFSCILFCRISFMFGSGPFARRRLATLGQKCAGWKGWTGSGEKI